MVCSLIDIIRLLYELLLSFYSDDSHWRRCYMGGENTGRAPNLFKALSLPKLNR